MVERSSLLLHIPEVPGSNLGLETGYPDRHFMIFLSPRSEYWNINLN
jgi:hypothetical protein